MASQEAELQEKIKKMTPEELKKFQMQNCIFCHIISGKVASKKVYEDDKCMALLDINPANPGHILLLPKEHYAIMPLIPDDTIQHLFMISKQLSAALLRALQSHGTNIFVANGAAAGQKAQHFMLHIIPRMENDGLNFDIKGNKISEKDMNALSKILAEKISKDMGIKVPEQKKEEPVQQEIKKEEVQEVSIEDNKELKKAVKKPKEKTVKKAVKSEHVTLDDIANLVTGGK